MSRHEVLIFESQGDQDQLVRLRRVVELSGCRHRAWCRDDHASALAVMAVLAPGSRAIPEDLRQDPRQDLPVLLLASDPLVQPVVLLAGGRLSLFDPSISDQRLIDALTALRQQHPGTASHRAGRSWYGPRWTATVIGSNKDLSIQVVDDGLVAVLSSGERSSIMRDLIQVAGLCSEPAAAKRLMPPVLAMTDAAASAVILPAGDGAWNVSRTNASHQVLLLSPRRLPSRWMLPVDQHFRHLPARRGDVLLVGSSLPDLANIAAVVGQGATTIARRLDEIAPGAHGFLVEVLK